MPKTELQKIVEDAYCLFSSYSFGNIVAVHHGICCLTEEDVQLLKSSSIEAIDRRLIYEYLDAGEELDQYALALQLKYLLPKILALLVDNQYIHHSYECIFDKCRFNLNTVWKTPEIELMNQFALCFFNAKIMQLDEINSIDNYMIMFHRSGLNIQPLLDEWLRHLYTPIPLINLISMLYYDFDHMTYNQAFADEKLIRMMNAWKNQLINNETFVNAIIDVLTSHQIYPQYQYMIDSVFEQL